MLFVPFVKISAPISAHFPVRVAVFVYGQVALALDLCYFRKNLRSIQLPGERTLSITLKKIIFRENSAFLRATFPVRETACQTPPNSETGLPKNQSKRSKITFPCFHCSLNLHHDSDGVHVLTVLECTAISDPHPYHNRAREHVAAPGAEASMSP